MFRLLLLLAVLAIAACGPADHTESGAITGVADDAKRARDSAQDAVAAAEAAAQRDAAASQTESSSGH
jgi:hypothetical protein